MGSSKHAPCEFYWETRDWRCGSVGYMTLLGFRDVAVLLILRYGGDVSVSVTLWMWQFQTMGWLSKKKCRFSFSSVIKQNGQQVPSACACPSFFLLEWKWQTPQMGWGEPSNKVCEIADTPVRHETIFGFPVSRNVEIEKHNMQTQTD